MGKGLNSKEENISVRYHIFYHCGWILSWELQFNKKWSLGCCFQWEQTICMGIISNFEFPHVIMCISDKIMELENITRNIRRKALLVICLILYHTQNTYKSHDKFTLITCKLLKTLLFHPLYRIFPFHAWNDDDVHNLTISKRYYRTECFLRTSFCLSIYSWGFDSHWNIKQRNFTRYIITPIPMPLFLFSGALKKVLQTHTQKSILDLSLLSFTLNLSETKTQIVTQSI